MDQEFVLTVMALGELEELGYKEAWIGNVENPHWPDHLNSHFLIATPKRKKNGWPAVWSVSEKLFGRQGCGNGLREADQCQRSGVGRIKPGHYKLVNDTWEIQ